MAIPDWITRLNAQGGQAYTDPTSGLQYVPMQTNGPTGPQDGYASIAANTPGLGQYVQNDYNMYDGQGNSTGTKRLGYTDDAFVKYMPYLIAAAVGGGAALSGAGAGAGTGLATGAGDAYLPGALGAGGSEVAYGSVIPGLESYALPAAAGGAAGGAAGASGGGGSSVGGYGAGSSAGMSAPAASNAAFNSALGSPFANLLPSGMGGLLGPAATLLGGMLGSKGQQKSETTTKDIPDWLKPSVAGLLTQTDALRNKQMQPGYMQGYDDMRTQGQSLLNAPIAGNGVGKIPYGRR